MLRIFTILVLIFLSACNQDDYQDQEQVINPVDPNEINYVVVLAGDDQTAPPNTIVTLSGTQRNTVGILWMQTQGTTATIEAPTQLVTNVAIPDIDQTEILKFQIVGINESGLYMAFDDVEITVIP